MTAIILAAGRGSRMLRLTEKKPKCLIELAGKTLFDWQINALKKTGIKDIAIVTGYLANSLPSHEYRYLFNLDWAHTDMVESLCCAHEILSQQETVVAYADIVYAPEIIQALLSTSGDIVITYDLLWQDLWMARFENPLEDAESFRISEGRLLEIGKAPSYLHEIEGQYMGLLKLTPKGWGNIWDYLQSISISKRKSMNMTMLLQCLIEKDLPVIAIPVKGRWCEIDSPLDLQCYEQKLQGKKNWSHDWRDFY